MRMSDLLTPSRFLYLRKEPPSTEMIKSLGGLQRAVLNVGVEGNIPNAVQKPLQNEYCQLTRYLVEDLSKTSPAV
jgi:hypothetical protein